MTQATGVVALLFTDLVGSTELLWRLGDEAGQELQRVHLSILRREIRAAQGREVKSLGDGVMATFVSPLKALSCAVAVQRAFAQHNRYHPERALRLRLGLHVGEPLQEEADFFGTAVVVASRLCDQAEAGQIVASELVAALVGSRGRFRFRSLGALELKGLPEPVRAVAVDWEDQDAPKGGPGDPVERAGTLRVKVLGVLTVEGAGGIRQGSALGPARDRQLLAFLATAGGAPVTRDVLIDALWADNPPQHPSRALSSLASRVRGALGPDGGRLHSEAGGFRLECETDLDELEGQIAAGDIEAALGLLASQFLAGEGEAEWIESRRRELFCRRVDLQVEAGRAALVREDPDTAMRWFSQAVAADGLREDGHRGVMEALVQSGREAEALRAYEHCRRTLREALGVSPSAETEALYTEIVRGSRPTRPVVRRPRRPGELPFMGRGEELRTLRSVLERADGTAVVVVAGEPGIGKTRLVREALEGTPSPRLAASKCFQLTASVPYALLDDLRLGLSDLPDATDGASGVRAAAGEGHQLRIAGTVAERLERQLPMVVFVDDLQWADGSSLQVLGMVLRRLAGQPLSVIATIREHETRAGHPARQFLELADRLAPVCRIALGPLTAGDVDAGGFSHADWERTGGHPLFLVERSQGATEADLAANVTERASRLGRAAFETLAAAAVLDRPASLDDLDALAGVGRDEVRQAASALSAEALLAERRGAWEVGHDVVAALVRAGLDPRTRRQLHRRAVDGLAGAPPAERARHAVEAEDWPRALELSLTAGEMALAAFADHEALGHFRTGLRVADDHGVGDAVQRRRLHLGCAKALLVQGKGAEGLDLIGALPSGEGREEFERLIWTSRAAWVAWRPSAALAPAQQALEVARELGDEALVGEAHVLVANPHGSLGDFERYFEHARQAQDILERLGKEAPALLWLRQAIIEHHRGQEREALDTLARLRRAAGNQHDETSLVMECWERALVLGGLGRYGEALAALDEVSRIGRGEEFHARTKVPNTRAWLLSDLGLSEEALDADEEALEEASRPEVGVEPTIQTLLNLARDHLTLGRPDPAAGYLTEADRLAKEGEVAWYRFTNRLEYLRGALALEAGDVDAALAAAEATAAMAGRFDAPRYRIRARILQGRAFLVAGRTQYALQPLRAAVRGAQQLGFAALAEEAHRLLAEHAGSDHHRRRADHWRGRIVASVDEPLRSRVLDARRLKPS